MCCVNLIHRLVQKWGLFFINVHFVKSLCLPQKISTKPHQNLFTLGGDSPKASGWSRVQKCEWRGNEEKSLMPRTFGYFKEQWLYHFPWMQLQEMNNAEELSEMSLQTFTHLLPSWASPLPPCTHYSEMCFSVGKRSLEPGEWDGFWGPLSIPTLSSLSLVSYLGGWVHSGCTAGPKEG